MYVGSRRSATYVVDVSLGKCAAKTEVIPTMKSSRQTEIVFVC